MINKIMNHFRKNEIMTLETFNKFTKEKKESQKHFVKFEGYAWCKGNNYKEASKNLLLEKNIDIKDLRTLSIWELIGKGFVENMGFIVAMFVWVVAFKGINLFLDNLNNFDEGTKMIGCIVAILVLFSFLRMPMNIMSCKLN